MLCPNKDDCKLVLSKTSESFIESSKVPDPLNKVIIQRPKYYCKKCKKNFEGWEVGQ